MTFRQVIIPFTGFQQSEAHRSSFEDGYFDHIARFQNAETLTYAPRPWKTNVQHLANQHRRQGIERAAILSYSHGQAAAVEYAKYAHSIGIDINLWIACDPVYRPTWLPRSTLAQILSFRAMLKKGTIKVPDCIARTVYMRQEHDRPRGHDLVPSVHGQTVELAGVLRSYGHTQIDGSPQWWALVKHELEAWVNPKKAVPYETALET